MFDTRKSNIGHVRVPKSEHPSCSIFQNRQSAMFDFPSRKSAMFDFPKSKIGHVRFSKIENRPCSIFQTRKSAMIDFPNRTSAMSEDRHPKTGTRKTGARKTGTRKTGTRKTESCIYFQKIILGVIISFKRLQDFVFFELIL